MTKQSRIVSEIEQMIALGRLRPGQMLPTQKELMDQFGVAMGTVQHALGRLQSRGVLTSTRGRGTVVSDSSALASAGIMRPRVELLEMVGTNWKRKDSLIEDATIPLQRILNDYGFDLTARHQLPDAPRELDTWAQQIRAAVVVGFLPPAVLQALRSSDRPAVIYGELYDAACPVGVSQVTVAFDNLMQLSLVYLASLGHRRIALIRGGGSRYYETIGTTFRKTAAAMGLERTVDEWVRSRRIDEAQVMERFQQEPVETRPTALLIDGGQSACRLTFELQRAGYRIPEDVSLFAISGQQHHQLTIPSLSRVETVSSRMGERLAEVLMEALQHRIVIRETVPPDLVPGDTCRSIVD